MDVQKKLSLYGFLFSSLVNLAAGGGSALAADTYVGKRCRICHIAETKAWELTKMARAFELLKPGVAADAKKTHKLDPTKDYTQDAACLPCHTTGYGNGGFQSLEATPDLAGVTCEVCHGAGGEYTKPTLMSLTNKEFKRADVVAAGLIMPDVKTCQTCHNEKSPFYKPFDFEKRKAQGVHKSFEMKFKH